MEPAYCLVSLVSLADLLYQRFASLDLVAYSEAAHDAVDLKSYLVTYLGFWYENYKSLNPGYAVPLTSSIFYLSVIFCANRHWGGGS